MRKSAEWELEALEGGFKKWLVPGQRQAETLVMVLNETDVILKHHKCRKRESDANKEAFHDNDNAVYGIWDETKHGKLLDQFMTVGDRANDDSTEQLAYILRLIILNLICVLAQGFSIARP